MDPVNPLNPDELKWDEIKSVSALVFICYFVMIIDFCLTTQVKGMIEQCMQLYMTPVLVIHLCHVF